MRILMLCTPPHIVGGMTTVAVQLRDGVHAAYPDIEVAYVDSGGGLGAAGYWRAIPAAVQCLRSNYDVMHLHVASKGSTWRKALMAGFAQVRGRPYVLHLHGGGYKDFLESLGPRRKRWIQHLFRRAATVIVLGHIWRDLVVNHLGVDPDQVSIIANGVAQIISDAGVQERPRSVVFVGTLCHKKGVGLLLKSFEEASSAVPEDWELVLLGNIGETGVGELVKRATERGAGGGRIRYVGPRFGEEKAKFICQASIFCLPSLAEALPMSLLEALSAGLPVIATDVGSISEVIRDRENGRLIPPDHPAALTDALIELMSNDDLRTELGSAGQQTWRQGFNADRVVDSVVTIWGAAVDRAKVGPTQ